MNIYLISQDENSGYDTYSECVACAASVREARSIHPIGRWVNLYEGESRCWASTPKNVKVKLIGKANNYFKKGIILSSFHAG